MTFPWPCTPILTLFCHNSTCNFQWGNSGLCRVAALGEGYTRLFSDEFLSCVSGHHPQHPRSMHVQLMDHKEPDHAEAIFGFLDPKNGGGHMGGTNLPLVIGPKKACIWPYFQCGPCNHAHNSYSQLVPPALCMSKHGLAHICIQTQNQHTPGPKTLYFSFCKYPCQVYKINLGYLHHTRV